MRLSNYTPGFVESYDAAARLCRVRIPGVTDGAEVMPQAMLCYPIGDKSEHTEIRILPGDRVWLDFVNGDPRFPIITGFRPKETDNAIEWRRWHHQNIELQADTDIWLTATGGDLRAAAGDDLVLTAGGDTTETAGGNITKTATGAILIEAGSTVTIRAPSILLDGNVSVSGNLHTDGALSYELGISGNGSARNNGVRVGSDHNHTNVQVGGNISGPPQVP